LIVNSVPVIAALVGSCTLHQTPVVTILDAVPVLFDRWRTAVDETQ
jgi:hypothetical protein